VKKVGKFIFQKYSFRFQTKMQYLTARKRKRIRLYILVEFGTSRFSQTTSNGSYAGKNVNILFLNSRVLLNLYPMYFFLTLMQSYCFSNVTNTNSVLIPDPPLSAYFSSKRFKAFEFYSSKSFNFFFSSKYFFSFFPPIKGATFSKNLFLLCFSCSYSLISTYLSFKFSNLLISFIFSLANSK